MTLVFYDLAPKLLKKKDFQQLGINIFADKIIAKTLGISFLKMSEKFPDLLDLFLKTKPLKSREELSGLVKINDVLLKDIIGVILRLEQRTLKVIQ